MARHELKLNGQLASCECGWHYKCPDPIEHPREALASLEDHLLDRYNIHRAKVLEREEAGA